ncbi:MAG TPA: hypothetical protein V6C65_32285, partial [Allocoleopsis sp.]
MKLNLSDLANLQNETTAVTTINRNNTLIKEAVENTISRDGTQPNQMNSRLDMNSNQIINLPDAFTDQEPVTYGQFIDGITSVNNGVVVDGAFIMAAHGDTTINDRVLSVGDNLQITDGGPKNNYAINISDPELNALALTVSDVDKLPYYTGAGTADVTSFTPYARTLVDDTDAVTARATLGVVIDTDVQPHDPTLNSLVSAGNGIMTKTALNTITPRSVVAPANGIAVTNGDGVAGNPTLSLTNDLAAIEGLSTTGLIARTATDTATTRTITGTANEITITNGDGIAGNPTVSIPAAVTFTGKTVTGGTYTGVSEIDISGTDLKMTGGGGTPTQGTANGSYLNPNLPLTQSSVETAGGVEGGVFAHDATGTVYQGAWSNHPLVLRTNNAGRITIDTAGAVKFDNYTTGTLATDVSGNVTAKSPTALKTDLSLNNVDNTSDATKNSAVATLTNKTLTSPVINSPTGIVKADVGLSNVDNTSDSTKNSASVTLTNKIISGSSNTINNIGNGSLSTAADSTIKSNISGSTASVSDNTITAVLDKQLGTTQGTIAYRGASAWNALTPGTSGNFLKTNGASANPAWAAIPGGGDLLSTNNLSDVSSAATSRANLGALGGGLKTQIFLSSGTFTTPSTSRTDTVYRYRMVGAGGGGAGANGANSAGGGGGGSAYAEGTFTGVAASTGITITVGAGGSGGPNGADGNSGGGSAIGSPVSISTSGGGGGSRATGNNNIGGAGGVISGTPSILAINGRAGAPGYTPSTVGVAVGGGDGADSILGIGGIGGRNSISASAVVGSVGYGSGGGAGFNSGG